MDIGKYREREGKEGRNRRWISPYTLTFISALQHTYAGFFGKVRSLWFSAHTNAPPPHPDRKRHNEPSVLSTPGGHA